MKYPVLPKPFVFVSPYPPDEVITRLNELIVTSWPYDAGKKKPFKGSIDGYAFEMQKIDEMVRVGWNSSRGTASPGIMGTIESNGSGSIIHLTSSNESFFSILIFAAVSLLVSLTVFIFTSAIIFPLMLLIPSIIMALNFYQFFANVARQQATLMLFFEGKKLSDQ